MKAEQEEPYNKNEPEDFAMWAWLHVDNQETNEDWHKQPLDWSLSTIDTNLESETKCLTPAFDCYMRKMKNVEIYDLVIGHVCSRMEYMKMRTCLKIVKTTLHVAGD